MERYLFPPRQEELETGRVLRKAIEAHAALGELKGVARSIPNAAILLNTLVMQEAKDSSAVENIITTHDELFKANLFQDLAGAETKEVLGYAEALQTGFRFLKEHRFLNINLILQLQSVLLRNNAGFRRLPGTVLKNDLTGEVVHTPPQHYDEIVALMGQLEHYLNDADDQTDPLVRMAVLHFQFESIHPFYDGNGRTGRILNILYLCLNDLLDYPILYLSRFIIQNKADYYRLLQEVRETRQWEPWVLFMLEGVRETARLTITQIDAIRALMDRYKREIREHLPNIYSKDLLESLFKHPYTKIAYIENDLNIHYHTARSYLEKLCDHGFLMKFSSGKHNYYFNQPLLDLFSGGH